MLVLTIHRPEARNAVDQVVWRALAEAFDQAATSDDIWAVVLTGAGDKAFCAGADVKALAAGEALAPSGDRFARWGFAGIVRHAISKPVIAAVNGAALGGGLEIVLACDMVVSASTAVFGLPEVRRGIMASAGGAFRLAAQVPRNLALEMILTGLPISATRAYEIGLVNRVAEPDAVLETALALANEACAAAPLAVQASKRVALGIARGEIGAEAAFWRMSETEHEALMQTDDAREGLMAFAERREPRWTAR